jgi:hypothetical protein
MIKKLRNPTNQSKEITVHAVPFKFEGDLPITLTRILFSFQLTKNQWQSPSELANSLLLLETIHEDIDSPEGRKRFYVLQYLGYLEHKEFNESICCVTRYRLSNKGLSVLGLKENFSDEVNEIEREVDCILCEGTGIRKGKTCTNCGGSGIEFITETVVKKIRQPRQKQIMKTRLGNMIVKSTRTRRTRLQIEEAREAEQDIKITSMAHTPGKRTPVSTTVIRDVFEDCKNCKGTGFKHGLICYSCGGSGIIY